MEARLRSKADCRSVEMRMSESAVVYTSRTLPVGWVVGGRLEVEQLVGAPPRMDQ